MHGATGSRGCVKWREDPPLARPASHDDCPPSPRCGKGLGCDGFGSKVLYTGTPTRIPNLDAPMREEFERVGEDLRSIRAAVEQHRVALERQESLIRKMLDHSSHSNRVKESEPASVPPLVLVAPAAGDRQGIECFGAAAAAPIEEKEVFHPQPFQHRTANHTEPSGSRKTSSNGNSVISSSDGTTSRKTNKSSHISHRSEGAVANRGRIFSHSSAEARKTSYHRQHTKDARTTGSPRNHRFLDMSALMQMNIDEQEYDVVTFYHTEGFAQALASNECFGNVTLWLILLNAVYIGVDAQWNTQDNILRAAWYFQVAEQFFCFFFLFEWIVRFCAFRHKTDCMKDNWFKFDTFLVCLMVLESWGLLLVFFIVESATGGGSSSTVSVGPLRLVRMLRLARMTRLMRALPELMTMIKGMRVAARAVMSSLLMLLGMIYVFAIVLYSFLRTEESLKDYFGSVGIAMFTLGMNGTFMDNSSDVLRMLINLGSWHTFSIFVIFILLSSMTIMNMLIGVLCEVVTAVAKAEKEMSAVAMVKQTLLVMLKALDEDGDDQISCDEIANVITDPNSMQVLTELKVDVTYLLEMLALAFRDPEASLSIKAVMEMIMSCRGDRPTSLKDLIDSLNLTRCQLLEELTLLEERVISKLPAKDEANHERLEERVSIKPQLKNQRSNLGLLCHQQSLVFSHLMTTIEARRSATERSVGVAALERASKASRLSSMGSTSMTCERVPEEEEEEEDDAQPRPSSRGGGPLTDLM